MGVFRDWSIYLLEAFGEIMAWVINLIGSILLMSPQAFSPGGWNLSLTIGIALAPISTYIFALLWGADLVSGVIDFDRHRSLQFLMRAVVMLALGLVFTVVAPMLVLGMFQLFQFLTLNVVGGGLAAGFNFNDFVSQTILIVEDMESTAGAIFFIFLIFAFLGFFGMFLSMALVPIAIFMEIFILAAFSSIPIATLFTARKDIGIAFLKRVASVSIRGSVVMFGIFLAFAIMDSPIFSDMGIALHGFLAFIIPAISITINIMILQKGIKGAEEFSKAITSAS
jgi:hypothetical protein